MSPSLYPKRSSASSVGVDLLVADVSLAQRLERSRDFVLVAAVLGCTQASDPLLAALARRSLGPAAEPLVGGASPVGMAFARAEAAEHALGHRARQLGEELRRLEVLVARAALEDALSETTEPIVLELGEDALSLGSRSDRR